MNLQTSKIILLIIRKALKRENKNHHSGDVFRGFKMYNKPLLITYSRSGTNWIRYFVETVSKKPTPGQKRVVEGNDYILDRAHAGFINAKKYKAIFLIVRNYRECLVRHHGLQKIRNFGSINEFLKAEKLSQPANWFIKNLEAFDAYKGEKLLIFYEDLILEPEKNLQEIGQFLGLSKSDVKQFIDKIEEHKIQSINAYTKFNRKSTTKGDYSQLGFHSTMLTPTEIMEFDAFYKQRHPKLFNQYLSKYEFNTK